MKKAFIFLIIFLFPISVSACSYIFQTPEEAYIDNPIVFIGKIIDLESIGGINGSREVTFEVLKSYKGIEENEIKLGTGANSALCGFDEGTLKEGQIWLIHTANIGNFNSLPANKSFESFDEAVSYADSLAENSIVEKEIKKDIEEPGDNTADAQGSLWNKIVNFFKKIFGF